MAERLEDDVIENGAFSNYLLYVSSATWNLEYNEEEFALAVLEAKEKYKRSNKTVTINM